MSDRKSDAARGGGHQGRRRGRRRDRGRGDGSGQPSARRQPGHRPGSQAQEAGSYQRPCDESRGARDTYTSRQGPRESRAAKTEPTTSPIARVPSTVDQAQKRDTATPPLHPTLEVAVDRRRATASEKEHSSGPLVQLTLEPASQDLRNQASTQHSVPTCTALVKAGPQRIVPPCTRDGK